MKVIRPCVEWAGMVYRSEVETGHSGWAGKSHFWSGSVFESSTYDRRGPVQPSSDANDGLMLSSNIWLWL